MSGTDFRQRLAAILAADVSGYSRLMAADERATVAALDAARAVFLKQIEASQGRVIDMAGDSVMAVFETATGAVSAAMAIQNEISANGAAMPEERRMRFRIGVHLGDVIEKADGTIYGDGVNIAARLEGLAEPGGITVSESIYTAVRGKIDAGFADRGEQQVKNIPHPVRAFAVNAATSAGTQRSASVADIDLSLPDKPSIAVLPFANMSGDPEQEYFTDGITEDIITELSRFHTLFVIARNSTFAYKGKAIDVRAVAKELGVRYVLEGSIRKAANRIRVTGQLIDSVTGNHIWAEKYDRVLEDVFEVQEEVTRAIVAAIAPQIDAVEREKARRRRPENLSAYEIAIRGSALAWNAIVKSDRALREQAILEAKKAIAIDPRSSLALSVLAMAQWQHVVFRTASDLKAAFEEGLAAAEKAIEVDPSNSDPYTSKAWLQQFAPEHPRWDEALASARHAYALNQNNMSALTALGTIETYVGNPDRGLEVLKTALRVSPRDPMIVYVYQSLATASCLSGNYANGVDYGLRGASLAPDYGFIHLHLSLNYVGLGEIEKANAAFQTARRLVPGFVESRLRGEASFRRREDMQRFTTFLRIAAGQEDAGAAEALR